MTTQHPTKTNKIPKGWTEKRLGEVTSRIGDGLHGTPIYSEDSEIYFINGNNLVNGKILFTENTKKVDSSLQIKNDKQLTKNTILISLNGTIGNIAKYNNEKIMLGKSVGYFNFKANRDYFYHFLLTDEIQTQLKAECTGSTIKNLSLKTLRELKINLPPLPEQAAIVAVLETWDLAITALQTKISTKSTIKKGLMHSLLTGQKRLPEFDELWVEKRLGEICEIKRGGSPRPIEEFITENKDGYNWLKIGDIAVGSKFITSTSSKIIEAGLRKTTIVEVGDFILSNSMSFGRPYISKIRTCIHDGWLALQNIKSNVDKDFLYYKLSSKEVQNIFVSISAGSGVQNLKKETVNEVYLSFPLLLEQQAIAAVLTTCDDEIEALREQLSLLQSQKKYLLGNLVTGAIRLPGFGE